MTGANGIALARPASSAAKKLCQCQSDWPLSVRSPMSARKAACGWRASAFASSSAKGSYVSPHCESSMSRASKAVSSAGGVSIGSETVSAAMAIVPS